jgi:WD40 repeat protein
VIVLAGAKGDVTHLALSADGRVLAATGGMRQLELWDIPSGNRWGKYDKMYFTEGPVAFHPTRPLCFAPSHSGIAEIETDTKKARHLGPEVRYARPRFGTWALAPKGEAFVGYLAGKIRRVARKPDDLSRVEWQAELTRTTVRSRHPLYPVAIRVCSRESFACVDAAHDRYWRGWTPARLTLRAMRDGSVLGSGKLPPGTLPVVAVSPDGRSFVTCRENVLSLWDAGDLKAKPRAIKSDTRSRLTGVAFHPSGKFLAVASNDRTVKLYDTATWKPVKTLTWDIGRLRSVCFSPDGTLAAAGSDTGKVVVWDVDV